MKKCFKGKSCFHFKTLDDTLERELGDMVALGIKLYQKDNLI